MHSDDGMYDAALGLESVIADLFKDSPTTAGGDRDRDRDGGGRMSRGGDPTVE